MVKLIIIAKAPRSGVLDAHPLLNQFQAGCLCGFVHGVVCCAVGFGAGNQRPARSADLRNGFVNPLGDSLNAQALILPLR